MCSLPLFKGELNRKRFRWLYLEYERDQAGFGFGVEAVVEPVVFKAICYTYQIKRPGDSLGSRIERLRPRFASDCSPCERERKIAAVRAARNQYHTAMRSRLL